MPTRLLPRRAPAPGPDGPRGADRDARRSARFLPYAVGTVLLLGSVLAGLLVGAADLPVRGVLLALLDELPFVHVDHGLTPVQYSVLMEIRMPRVLGAVLVGSLLAVAGAGYQGVFRNPMADPYLLGAASGAGLGATLVIAYSSADSVGGVGIVPLAAFVGAIAGVMLAYALGATAGRADGTATLVLAGVAVSAFLAAVQTFVQQANVDELRRIYAWILGSLSSIGWDELALVAPYAAVSTLVLLLHGRLLDVMTVGDEEAAVLGVNAARVRFVVLLAASLATATAVAVSGLIGFIGIVVPHAVRRLVGGSYRRILPMSVLLGGAFLVVADIIARTATAPGELPIGVVTAFVGAPFFVIVLRATRQVGL
ncbi:FecCD family ABC transporter permease [Yinghuangia seranimata]|uniref:FecCD family ABC transporter permease n=1 Tax=Yinghuangia seranimata TaxID=408067 RepID=UPI00248ABCDC|nr:iron ABC transporter permease [Yinghuangia seranimata]MDI2129239.1 iron ABC transporter permease [Yinghuangia seranimata]